jgi:HEPN domain.
MCHQAVGKALKACSANTSRDMSPKYHDWLKLAHISELLWEHV